MMTTKKFNKAMAEANKTNKRNTIIASTAAGVTGLVAAGITFVIGHCKNKKIDTEINNLKTDINNINTAVTVTENILAATTKAAAANDDVKDNVKYVSINIYEFTGAINNTKNIYTKSKSGDTFNFTALVNPTINSYVFGTKYYMTESDYNEIFKAEEKAEDKADAEKK